MIALILSLFKSSTFIYSFVGGIMTTLVYFFGKFKAKEEVKNQILQENIKNVTQQSEKVAAIQKEQVKIAAEPSPDRDATHDWMLDLNKRDQK